MEPYRRYECMGDVAATEREAKEAFSFEETMAQQSANHIRKPVSIELRDTTNNFIIAHKRFQPIEMGVS